MRSKSSWMDKWDARERGTGWVSLPEAQERMRLAVTNCNWAKALCAQQVWEYLNPPERKDRDVT